MLSKILDPLLYFFRVYNTAFALWKGPTVTQGKD